jgi:hypothetical protein
MSTDTRLEDVQALLRGALAAATDADDVAALALARRPSDTPFASAVRALDARALASPFVAAVLRAVWQASSLRAFHVPSIDPMRHAALREALDAATDAGAVATDCRGATHEH